MVAFSASNLSCLAIASDRAGTLGHLRECGSDITETKCDAADGSINSAIWPDRGLYRGADCVISPTASRRGGLAPPDGSPIPRIGGDHRLGGF